MTVLRSTRFHLLELARPHISLGEARQPCTDAPGEMMPTPSAADSSQALQATLEETTIDAPQPSLPATTAHLVGASHVGATNTSNSHAGGLASADGATVPSLAVKPESGLTEAQLRRMYEDILGCFDVHSLQVSAAAPEDEPYVEGPASVLFKVRPGKGVDPRKLWEKGQALKLALELEQEQNVNFSIDRGFVTIDVPKRPEQRYFVGAGDTWRRWSRPEAALAVPLGEDEFGKRGCAEFLLPQLAASVSGRHHRER